MLLFWRKRESKKETGSFRKQNEALMERQYIFGTRTFCCNAKNVILSCLTTFYQFLGLNRNQTARRFTMCKVERTICEIGQFKFIINIHFVPHRMSKILYSCTTANFKNVIPRAYLCVRACVRVQVVTSWSNNFGMVEYDMSTQLNSSYSKQQRNRTSRLLTPVSTVVNIHFVIC